MEYIWNIYGIPVNRWRTKNEQKVEQLYRKSKLLRDECRKGNKKTSINLKTFLFLRCILVLKLDKR